MEITQSPRCPDLDGEKNPLTLPPSGGRLRRGEAKTRRAWRRSGPRLSCDCFPRYDPSFDFLFRKPKFAVNGNRSCAELAIVHHLPIPRLARGLGELLRPPGAAP